MKVAYLAAGAAGMYCGSCMRDNRLAATLIEQGKNIVLVPLYTPLRTDERDVSRGPVYYGGINVYLQQVAGLFRHLPRVLRDGLDAPELLRKIGRFAGSTDASRLGALTVSMLEGAQGRQRAELEQLGDALREMQPDLVNLPNLMFLGVAGYLKRRLDVPIVCTLSGEDVFVDALCEPHRSRAMSLIETHGEHIDAFVAVTRYFADHAARHFSLPRERIHTIPMGIRIEHFEPAKAKPPQRFTIGFLARICPEKGLHNIVDAYIDLRGRGMDCSLRVAGFLASVNNRYLNQNRRRIEQAGFGDRFEYVGELSHQGKVDFLQRLSVLSVPTEYREAKGFYLLEAMAAGIPVVQPDHGSFGELIEMTKGGLLFEAGRTDRLADTLARLSEDAALRADLGRNGRAGVKRHFEARTMAEQTWRLYEGIVRDRSEG